MDLKQEKTICIKCTNFMLAKFSNSNRPYFKCLVDENMLNKISEDRYYDKEGNKCKLPIVEKCSQIIDVSTMLMIKDDLMK